jgi:fibronectin-binding autotransporter adhesin
MFVAIADCKGTIPVAISIKAYSQTSTLATNPISRIINESRNCLSRTVVNTNPMNTDVQMKKDIQMRPKDFNSNVIRRLSVVLITSSMVLAFSLIVTPIASATSYNWSGGTSAWALASNWGAAAFPNAAGDQATINIATNNPVQITTSVTLGGAAPSLTINGAAAATAFDIASAGTLIMNATSGGITNDKVITIEGTLNTNLGGATTRHYSIAGAGSISLLGGTITGSSTRGYWDFNQAVNGYGTLTGRIFNYSTITAISNTAGAGNTTAPIAITGTTFTMQGGTLAATGDGYFVNSGTISGIGTISAPVTNNGTIAAGATTAGTLLISGNITGNNTTGGFGGGSTITIAANSEIDLNGATVTNHYISASPSTAVLKLTGDSAFAGTVGYSSNGSFTFNGHTLNLGLGNAPNTGASLTAIGLIDIAGGTLNNATAYTATLFQTFHIEGGSITSTGGGSFIGGGIYGYGTISAPITPIGSAAIVNANTSGQTLFVTGPVNLTNNSSNGNLVASSGGILDLGAGCTVSTAGPANFTGYINPSTGAVNLDGVNVAGGTSPINLAAGAVNVIDDSNLGGTIGSAATITINAGKTLSMSGATVNVTSGSITNNGALAVGAGTLNNSIAGAYALNGSGNVTLTAGSITSTGGGGFTSTNTISGYGIISAALSNLGTVSANGSGNTLSLTGPVVQLPASTLTGGSWIANANSTLNIASAGNILANQGTVILNGAGSQFANIDSINDNQGSFSVEGGRSFTTAGNLANSGTLLVDGGGTFSVTGDLTGTGNTTVAASSQMYADSIVQDTITLGAGATLTIRAISGGPTAGAGGISPVPEPGVWLLVLTALLAWATNRIVAVNLTGMDLRARK